jgi:predicted RNA binding protein with dsRBD fold (UPF0201 family)
MVSVQIRCPIYPSEDPEKVREAIMSIFPDAVLETDGGEFRGEASTGRFYTQIRKQKILDSTRSMMFKGIRNGKITLYLNKQVASVGKISFTEPKTILGTITVVMEADEPEVLIDSIAPRTVNGEEVR